MQPNTRHRFLRTTSFNDLTTFVEGTEFYTNSQGAGDFRVTRAGGADESRTIPTWILTTWLEDGRIEAITAWKPKDGETFFKFNGMGEVEEAVFGETILEFVEFGNYFETREEAETVVQQIAQSLMEYHASKV